LVKIERQEFKRLEFLNASVLGTLNTKVFKVISSGVMNTKYGTRIYLDLECDNKQYRLLLNKTSLNRLADLGFKDTEELHGKFVELNPVVVLVGGKMRNTIVIAEVREKA